MNTQHTQDDFRYGTDRDSVIHLKTIQDKTLESVQDETWDQYIDRLIYTGLGTRLSSLMTLYMAYLNLHEPILVDALGGGTANIHT